MELIKVQHHKDYVRYSKDLTIKVNDIITVKANCYGGLIESETPYGEVLTLEDPECDLEFFINGELCKYVGFKDLYTKLFTGDFQSFEDRIIYFANNEIGKTQKNYIGSFKKHEVIDIYRHELESLPVIKDKNDNKYVRNHWFLNSILESLNIEFLSTEKVDTINNKKHWAVSYNAALDKLEELKQKL